MSVWMVKYRREQVRPMTANTRKLRALRNSPFIAVRSALAWLPSPRLLDSRALMPTPVPTATAIIRFCTGKASDTAFSASSLSCATKTLSTTL